MTNTISKIKLPPYSDFPLISNERVLLRQIKDSDINDIVEISYYDSKQATTIEQASEMNDRIITDYKSGNSIHWGIVDKQTHKIVGTCGYYRGFANHAGELGCVLLPQYRGKGFMTAAMLLAINFGFNEIGLKRIWAITSQQNQKAIQLLQVLNFAKVKVLDYDEVEFELNPEQYINQKK